MSTETYEYTSPGSAIEHEIPVGVTSVTIECYGPGGDDGYGNSGDGSTLKTSSPGDGAYAKAVDYPLSGNGDTLYMYVGERAYGQSGGWPNGGNGGSVTHADDINMQSVGGGGGGGTSVRLNGTSYSSRIIVAGGGGGGGTIAGDIDFPGTSDGANGNNDSEDAVASSYFGMEGATTDVSGTDGGNGTTDYDSSHDHDYTAAGGGGGGGLQAGEGGHGGCRGFEPEAAASGGAGGMSWVDAAAASQTINDTAGHSGDGRVVIKYDRPGALYYNGSSWTKGGLLTWNGSGWNSAGGLGYDGSDWK